MTEKQTHSSNDLKLAGVLLFVSLLLILFSLLQKKPGKILVITLDGEEVVREELREGKEWVIETGDGGKNIFAAEKDEDGTLGVRCLEADCPNQICVEKGFVSLTDDPIVCLPHKVTAKLIEE